MLILRGLRGVDLNGDGIPGGIEVTYGASPFLFDTDHDGLSDAEEINPSVGDPTHLVLLLFGSADERSVEVQLYDFSHGAETDFARAIREEIERRLAGVAPGRRIRTAQEKVRALPP
jgi:hypothetical protein